MATLRANNISVILKYSDNSEINRIMLSHLKDSKRLFSNGNEVVNSLIICALDGAAYTSSIRGNTIARKLNKNNHIIV